MLYYLCYQALRSPLMVNWAYTKLFKNKIKIYVILSSWQYPRKMLLSL